MSYALSWGGSIQKNLTALSCAVFIGVNMDINIYEDFLSKAEIEFLTGRKQKSLVIEQLNAMGIPFMQNANGYPIVRRDYDTVKSRTAKTEFKNNENNAWRPSVLQE